MGANKMCKRKTSVNTILLNSLKARPSTQFFLLYSHVPVLDNSLFLDKDPCNSYFFICCKPGKSFWSSDIYLQNVNIDYDEALETQWVVNYITKVLKKQHDASNIRRRQPVRIHDIGVVQSNAGMVYEEGV